jgi:hypothetical protein
MRQLTIFANSDLEPQVLAAMDHARIDAFLRVGEASGNRFLPPGELPRTVAWDAVMFVVPAVASEKVQQIATELSAAARNCGTEPCLRIVATPAEIVV